MQRSRFEGKCLWLALVLLAAVGTASAQDYAFEWNPRSGDPWVDAALGDVNRYGARYGDAFADEMVRYYAAPRELVADLLVRQRWAPGDVYYACAIAQVIGRACRYVADEWSRDHEQGWGQVAMRLGIKPGSPEFKRLKQGFASSYAHWGRDVPPDPQLRHDRADHGSGKNRGNAGKENGKGRKPH